MSDPIRPALQAARWLLVAVAVGIVGLVIGDDVGAIIFLVAFVGGAVAALSIIWDLLVGNRRS